jgi:hypothetical protein
MTLCIAATATHKGEPAIILCHDWRTESGDVAGGDVEDKLSWIIPKELAVLKAGIVADADRMAAVYASFFQSLPPGSVTAESSRALLDVAFQKYRWTLTDDYLIATLGIPYAGLLGGIKNAEGEVLTFPDGFVEEKLHQIESLAIPDCLLIVAGFVEKRQPVIGVLNEVGPKAWCRVRLEKNFAAIGSGAPAALISLYRREHGGPDVTLMQAIYNVYEAKLSGEVSPGVGDATSITVLFPNGNCWDLNDAGHKFMLERYRYFGPIAFNHKRPKLTRPYFKFDPALFEDYEMGWQRINQMSSEPGPQETP